MMCDELSVPTRPPLSDQQRREQRLNTPMIERRYQVLDKYGQGAYGDIIRARDLTTGRTVIIKRMRAESLMRQFLREVAILQRVRHAKCIECLDVIPFSSTNGGRVQVICEFLPLNLHEYRMTHQNIVAMRVRESPEQHAAIAALRTSRVPPGLVPLRHIQKAIRDVIEAAEYLHRQCVVHRDIKPENIVARLDLIADCDGSCGEENPALVAKAFEAFNNGNCVNRENAAVVCASRPHIITAKLCDFGSSRISLPACSASGRTNTPQRIFTQPYRPPEVLLEGPYHTAADMWSIGCVLAELALGDVLFPFKDPDDTNWGHLITIIEVLGTPTVAQWQKTCHANIRHELDLSVFPNFEPTLDTVGRGLLRHRLGPHGMDLLKRLLCFVPGERITAVEALRHPYFAQDFSAVDDGCDDGKSPLTLRLLKQGGFIQRGPAPLAEHPPQPEREQVSQLTMPMAAEAAEAAARTSPQSHPPPTGEAARAATSSQGANGAAPITRVDAVPRRPHHGGGGSTAGGFVIPQAATSGAPNSKVAAVPSTL